METGTYDGGWGWGAKFLDYDNDADLDLVALDGFISAGDGDFWYDLASWIVTGEEAADAANWPAIGDRSFSGYQRNRLWRNDGGGSFSERSRDTGMTSEGDGRGAVVLDFDDDGDLDLYFANQGQPPDLYRNLTRDRAAIDGDGRAGGSHWLGLVLEADPATGTNRDAVGTRVTVAAGGVRQIRERDGGNGFAGQSDPRLHFGLGGAGRAELVEIRWPDGGVQHLEDVAADRYLTVRQDPALYSAAPRLQPDRPAAPAPPDPGRTPAPAPAPGPDLEHRLAELEQGLARPPLSHGLAATYRRLAAAGGAHDRAIDTFERLAARRPDDPAVRLELGSALIDKVPTCGGVAAVVCKGQLANRALEQFGAAIELDPRGWGGWFARGIDHLHWPRALRHSDDAAADLERAVALEEAGAAPAAEAPRLRTRVALGDAYAKAGDSRSARRAWRRGLVDFPASAELAARLAIDDDDALLAYVEDQRSLERPIDTDLSFLDPAGL
jgi:tetratricopeptide (TPR) repeat protein